MTEDKRTGLQYRFSDYPPPLVQLDGTGPAYWVQWYTHPYYSNQPQCWQQPIYRYGGVRHFGNVQAPPSESQEGQNQLYSLLPVCQK